MQGLGLFGILLVVISIIFAFKKEKYTLALSLIIVLVILLYVLGELTTEAFIFGLFS